MSSHFIDDDGLVRAVRRLVPSEDRETAEAAIRRYLERQPRVPDLVGPTVAARILGVPPPHITRLKAKGRMPDAVAVEGSFDAYVRGELEPLAESLANARKARKKT